MCEGEVGSKNDRKKVDVAFSHRTGNWCVWQHVGLVFERRKAR